MIKNPWVVMAIAIATPWLVAAAAVLACRRVDAGVPEAGSDGLERRHG